jgi:AraC-like DNA-binding protein
LTCRALVPYECRPKDRASFEGEISLVPFAGRLLTLISHNGMTTWRTRRQVAQSRDSVFVCAQLTGSVRISQNGRDAILQPADLALVDNASASTFVSTLNSKKIVIKLSRKDCEARLGRMARWTARRIDGSAGAGALVSHFVQLLPDQVQFLSETAQHQIVRQVIDLLALALIEDEVGTVACSSARLASLLRLKAVVDDNLTNGSVTCDELATAAGISVRYANQLLDAEQISLQRLLFSRRIAKCQAALADPMQAHRQISDIAYSWGFGDVSHFGRLFKAMTGITPRDYRKQSLEPSAQRS